MVDRELVPTQSRYLALKAERNGMQEGYRFLDEKRLILAAEILAQLRAYSATKAAFDRAHAAAQEAVRAAVLRHGLDDLSLYPLSWETAPAPGSHGDRPEVPDQTPVPAAAETPAARGSRDQPWRRRERSVLGVRVEELLDPADAGRREPPALAQRPPLDASPWSPEAEQCRRCCARLLPLAAQLAVQTGNLERLRGEYLRTARRARALEEVLLPELDTALRRIEGALEELDREEAVRAHGFAER